MNDYITITQEIKAKTDIISLISETVTLKKRGRLYVGPCPFHFERTPSFTVYPDTNSFYCFGCQAGGDVYNFIMKRDNLSFQEAKEALAIRAGVDIGPPTAKQRQEFKKASARRERIRAVAEEYQKLIERETERLIFLEQLVWAYTQCIYDPQDLEQPFIIWALRSKSIIEHYLDRLMYGKAKERLYTALQTQGVDFDGKGTRSYKAG